MRRLTRDEILRYEVSASWWSGWIRNDFLQGLSAKYFAWKVNRKYNRYLRSLELHRLLNLLEETEKKVGFGIAGRVKRWHTETVDGQEIRVIDRMDLDSVSLLPTHKGDT